MRTRLRLTIPALLILVLTPLFLPITGCARSEAEPVKRVILVVIDTLRGDYLGCAGGPVSTPTMDGLAARGVRFAWARSHAPITGPSHSSLFTGLYPFDHGVLNNTQILNDQHTTLAERFRGMGWRTAGFISLGVLRVQFGMAQGFDVYDEKTGKSWSRNAGQVNDAVLPWLEGVTEEDNIFLWVHYSDPHEPYAAPGRRYPSYELVQQDGTVLGLVNADGGTYSLPVELSNGQQTLTLRPTGTGPEYPKQVALEAIRSQPAGCRFEAGAGMQRGPQKHLTLFAQPPAAMEIIGSTSQQRRIELLFQLKRRLPTEKRRAEYGYEVEYVDRQLEVLVDALDRRGLLEDSLLVLTSDHGEGLGDHGLFGHVHQLYDSLLHVPLIMVAPGRLPSGITVEQPVSLVDLLPTICKLSGIPPPTPSRGRSLLAVIAGEAAPGHHIAVTARPEASADLEGIVADGLKLVHHPESGRSELYDLTTDPAELHDIAPLRAGKVASFEAELQECIADSEASIEWAELDEESRKNLEALGYVH